MKVEGVHSILLNVSNLPRSVEFYSDLLQMIPITQGDKATFQLGATPFILHESKSIDIPDDTKRGIGVSLKIQVANIDAHWEKVNLGFEIPPAPANSPPVARQFEIYDPDGYQIVLAAGA